jgi:hypothetical protein
MRIAPTAAADDAPMRRLLTLALIALALVGGVSVGAAFVAQPAHADGEALRDSASNSRSGERPLWDWRQGQQSRQGVADAYPAQGDKARVDGSVSVVDASRVRH